MMRARTLLVALWLLCDAGGLARSHQGMHPLLSFSWLLLPVLPVTISGGAWGCGALLVYL